jgi:hypothetical protein
VSDFLNTLWGVSRNCVDFRTLTPYEKIMIMESIDFPQDSSKLNHVSLIWSIAEILRGDFKAHQYGSIILPFVVLRRLEYAYQGRLRLPFANTTKFIFFKKIHIKASYYNTSVFTALKDNGSEVTWVYAGRWFKNYRSFLKQCKKTFLFIV